MRSFREHRLLMAVLCALERYREVLHRQERNRAVSPQRLSPWPIRRTVITFTRIAMLPRRWSSLAHCQTAT